MFGEKALTLIKELDRNRDILPLYNADLVNDVINEIKLLIRKNQEDAMETELNRTTGSNPSVSYIPTIRCHHAIIKRNVRCLLAYHYHRLRLLRDMRWQFGSILPDDIKNNLSSSELIWFTKYSSALTQYMSSIGPNGLNLMGDLKPPKTLNIEVICLVDYGRFELSDGTVVLLKKNNRHYLPRTECEELIRKGIVQHIG